MKYFAFPQEKKNRNLFFSFLNYDYNSPACEKIHFHKNYEFILVEEGFVNLFLDGNSYTLSKGQAILIQPYQAHSFHLTDNSRNFTYNFSKKYVSSFDALISDKRIINPIFTTSETVTRYLTSQTIENFGKKIFLRSQPDKKTETIVKSITYSICSEFLKNAEFSDNKNKSQNIIMEVIEYVCDNFEENISLKDFAQKYDYNYQYLSRRFNSFFDMGFKDVLNRYRIEQAVTYLQETDQPISSIAFASGFQSIRSFNDACLKYYNKTPSKIREEKNK